MICICYNATWKAFRSEIFLMSDTLSYDERVQTIRAYNQPIIEDFRAWLEQSSLSEKTVRKYVFDIKFFTEYLVYYDDPLKKLDESDSSDVRMFLRYWFPRKAMWSSTTSVKSYLASFRKFFNWLGETGCISPETVADVLTTLKEGRDEFLEAVAEP
jgi:site-specific recombinase XerD